MMDMNKLRTILRNKWVGFGLAATLYTLWFVVWTGNLWLLLGLPLIFDLYITKFFQRYVGSRNKRLCERSKAYKAAYEWVNAIVFATVVATLVHLFIFQMYVIPTSSMEQSLLVGDYLYVSKVTYGPQMPNTPVSFPFVHHTMPFSQTRKSFSEIVKWPYHRLKGLRKVRRNDVVVFNFPAGDTVALKMQNPDYYTLKHRLGSQIIEANPEYQAMAQASPESYASLRDYLGKSYIEQNPQIFGDVIWRPVDRREDSA